MTRFLIGTKFVSCFLALSLVATPSSYVLPYPSFMPGHKLFKVKNIFDRLYGIWCFGSLAQFKYNLRMTDKKLVEAKTLFEYGQLSLGITAMRKYKFYLNQTFLALERARGERKNISQKSKVFGEAMKKHKEVLDGLLSKVPETVYWQEERKEGKVLKIREELNSALNEAEILSQRLVRL